MSKFVGLNAYDRHKLIINEYVLNQPGNTKLLIRDTSRDKTDVDVIRENHRFLWDEDEEPDSWERQLARKYYDKLYKEYCICDLSRYKENKVAMRWRVSKEVLNGKGQFNCGNRNCSSENDLRSWEVHFAYLEEGERKNALVKLRLCSPCSDKLNYHSKKREVKRIKEETKRAKKEQKNRKRLKSQDGTGDESIRAETASSSNFANRKETIVSGNVSTSDDDNISHFCTSNELRKDFTGNAPTEKKLKQRMEFQKYIDELLV